MSIAQCQSSVVVLIGTVWAQTLQGIFTTLSFLMHNFFFIAIQAHLRQSSVFSLASVPTNVAGDFITVQLSVHHWVTSNRPVTACRWPGEQGVRRRRNPSEPSCVSQRATVPQHHQQVRAEEMKKMQRKILNMGMNGERYFMAWEGQHFSILIKGKWAVSKSCERCARSNFYGIFL